MKNRNENKSSTLVKKMLPTIILLLLIIIIVVLFLLSGAKSKKLKTEQAEILQTENQGMNVVVMPIAAQTIRDRINLPGMIEPFIDLEILAEVSGKINKKLKKEGETVSEGDVLYQIDDRDYKNTYISSKAAYETASSSFKRFSELHKKNLATKSQLDTALNQLEGSRAAMDNAALNLERCTVKAPISGIINRMDVKEGRFVSRPEPLAQILDLDPVKVTVGIPESDVNAVRRLDLFDVQIDALDNAVFKARKKFLSKTTESTARLYNLELTIDNPEGYILPDMFARIEIIKKEIHNAVAVPVFSVISTGDDHVVYIADQESRAKRIVVETGILDGFLIEIKSGLKPGDRLIVAGQREINDRQKINVVRTVKDAGELQ